MSRSSVESQLASYEINAINYACVYAIANTIADLPKKIYTLDSEGNEVISDNKYANQMCLQVNPQLSWYDYLEGLSTLMELTGFGMTEVVYPQEPKELWLMRSDLTDVKVNEEGVSKFIYTANGKRETFYPAHMQKKPAAFQTKYFNPVDFNRGLSPFLPMQKQLAIDRHSLLYLEAFFKNGAHIDGILSSPVELPQQKKDELYAQFREKYGGASKSFNPLILSKDWDFKKLQADPKESDVTKQREITRMDIFTTRGVYPIVLGFLDGASYANANIQWRLYYRNTIKPKATKIEQALNYNVFSKYGVRFKFDFTAIPELKEDEKEKAITASTYAKSGIYTRNEIRMKLGDSPMKDEQLGNEIPVKSTANPFDVGGADSVIKSLKKKAIIYERLSGCGTAQPVDGQG